MACRKLTTQHKWKVVRMQKIEIDLLDSDAEKSLRSSAARLLGKILGTDTDSTALRDKIWPAATGGNITVDQCSLRLLPLSRLGAAEGKSSASVFVAYFITEGETWPSIPCVVKFALPRNSTDLDSCRREFRQSEQLRSYLNHVPEGFAIPFVCHDYSVDQPYSVLWSPLAAIESMFGTVGNGRDRPDLKIDDIWQKLTCSEIDSDLIDQALQHVFEALIPVHKKCGDSRVECRSFLHEYGKYLRKIEEGGWAQHWHSCWGDADSESVHDFGRTWPNPFWVLKQLLPKSVEMYIGGVHGDLHPKNIVLSRSTPKIIDFGWSNHLAHVAKDFVLLECNLRFVTLSVTEGYEDINRLAEFLSFSHKPPSFTTSSMKSRIRLIRSIREAAKRVFPGDTNWDNEYVFPMFLVAIGLLKHAHDFSSQISARLHVLHLSEYVYDRLKSGV